MKEDINLKVPPPPAPADIRPKTPQKAPPALRKLEIHDGDVICMPADTLTVHFEEMVKALRRYHAGKQVLVVCGDLQALDEAAMNAAGWYRK